MDDRGVDVLYAHVMEVWEILAVCPAALASATRQARGRNSLLPTEGFRLRLSKGSGSVSFSMTRSGGAAYKTRMVMVDAATMLSHVSPDLITCHLPPVSVLAMIVPLCFRTLKALLTEPLVYEGVDAHTKTRRFYGGGSLRWVGAAGFCRSNAEADRAGSGKERKEADKEVLGEHLDGLVWSKVHRLQVGAECLGMFGDVWGCSCSVKIFCFHLPICVWHTQMYLYKDR